MRLIYLYLILILAFASIYAFSTEKSDQNKDAAAAAVDLIVSIKDRAARTSGLAEDTILEVVRSKTQAAVDQIISVQNGNTQ